MLEMFVPGVGVWGSGKEIYSARAAGTVSVQLLCTWIYHVRMG